MSWFSNLFKWPEDHPASPSRQVEVTPRIKLPKQISEPVISFVETFKANPGRFSIVLGQDMILGKKGDKFYGYEYTEGPLTHLKLVDKKAKLEWNFALRSKQGYFVSEYFPHPLWSYPKFLSEDEAHFIFDEVRKVYEKRAERLKSIFNTKEREALKKVYCRDSI